MHRLSPAAEARSATIATRRAWLRAGSALLLGGPLAGLQAQQAEPTRPGAAPSRVVSIGGAITETLYALGAEGLLVGVDTTSLHPPAATRLPSVGYARSLSAEGVLSLRPDQVLASDEAGPPAVLTQLEAAGVTVTRLAAGFRYEGMLDRSRRIAALVGRAPAGATLIARIEAEWQAAQAGVARRTARGAPPRVMFILAHTPQEARVAGSRTAAEAMLHYAGAVNAVEGFAGYRPLAPEAAIAAAPDVLLVTDQGIAAAGGIDGLLRFPGLAQTPAGRARRVASVEALLLLGFGPRLPQAVATLADALHGRT